jgi:hypothetical protein
MAGFFRFWFLVGEKAAVAVIVFLVAVSVVERCRFRASQGGGRSFRRKTHLTSPRRQVNEMIFD